MSKILNGMMRTAEQQKALPAFRKKFNIEIAKMKDPNYVLELGGTTYRLNLWREHIEIAGLENGPLLEMIQADLQEVGHNIDATFDLQAEARESGSILMTMECDDPLILDFMTDIRNIVDAYNDLVSSYNHHIEMSRVCLQE